MNRSLLFLVGLAAIAPVLAAHVDVKIPKENWSISFDSPPLAEKQESKKSGEYAFSANSGRFNISFFVEKPKAAGSGNRAVYEYYWPLASQNPLIAKDTITQSESDRYVRVQYDITTSLGGKNIRQKNVNYYFASHGKWVDVHISVIEPTAADEEIFSTFDSSLKYGS